MKKSDKYILEEDHIHFVLIYLRSAPGILRSKLYDSVNGASRPTVQKRVDRLLEEGYLYIEKSKTHAAGEHLFLTDKGRELANLAVHMKRITDGESNAGDDSDDVDYSSSQRKLDSVAAMNINKK